jgi:MFS family permease
MVQGETVRVEAKTPPSTMNIVAAVLGNALEFYDFLIYASFAVMIGRAFFPTGSGLTSLLLSVATFGVGFVTRPLGGIVIGAYADRAGRKAAMTLTIWLMALGSGMIGLVPDYSTIGWAAPVLLVLARLLQGFSAGGELGPATTYLIEAAPPGREGFYGSWQLGSQFISSIIGGLVGFAVTASLTPDEVQGWGWRIPFLLGILIAPVGIYIRRQLEETLPGEAAHETSRAVLADLFGRHWKVLLAGTLAIPGATITQYFLTYITTYAITTLHLPAETAMLASFVVGVFGTAAAIAGGLAADRFGFKGVAIVPRLVLMAALYPAVLSVVRNPDATHLFVVAAILSVLQASSGAIGILMIPRAFPAIIRTSGLSIAYAIGVTLFGGTAQFVFTWLIGKTGDPLSPVWYVIGMNLITLLGLALLRPAATPRPQV